MLKVYRFDIRAGAEPDAPVIEAWVLHAQDEHKATFKLMRLLHEQKRLIQLNPSGYFNALLYVCIPCEVLVYG